MWWAAASRSSWTGFQSRRLAHACEIGRCVHGEWRFVDDADNDSHSVFERAQLLEIFSFFKRRWWKRNESRQRLAAVSVDTDVMVQIAYAGWDAAAAEIECA